MKILVTGASGFIGSHLTRRLLENKHSVRLLLHHRHFPGESECSVVWGDITDPGILKKALEDRDIVFHLSAALGASLIGAEEFRRINVEGTEKLLFYAEKAGVKRFIHFSSAGVLGRVEANSPADEKHTPYPIDVYDLTKLEGEKAALEAGGNKMEVVIIRPGWVYGPEDKRTFKLIRAIARKRFVLVSRGNTRQTPVYVNDLIQGILLCAEKGKSGEIYHMAGHEVLTVRDIVRTIAQAVGTKIPRVRLSLLPVKTAAWILGKSFRFFGKEAPLTPSKLSFFIHPKPLSIEKARRELGYAPQMDFSTGIKKTVEWYREKGWM
ncbi:MAG: NAD-dependent epimerase/dehydratase family protein [Candidatus Aminicenantes bacterium]|nr:NAD-dependent epimerase/dehydratase family protein [Candidatus Aminicenantes bacterium]